MWDQFKQSQFNWLWWECVTFQHYAEETSYENSLLVQQTGTLALSSLTHVLRSLTPNARYHIQLDVISCWMANELGSSWLYCFLQRNFQTAGEISAGKQRQSFIYRCEHMENFWTDPSPTMSAYCYNILLFRVTVCRIVIPRLLPALSRGVLGQLWPHAEDAADWVQRPQTDSDTQGGASFNFRVVKSYSVL